LLSFRHLELIFIHKRIPFHFSLVILDALNRAIPGSQLKTLLLSLCASSRSAFQYAVLSIP
jgi:hypothetical protein